MSNDSDNVSYSFIDARVFNIYIHGKIKIKMSDMRAQ